MYACTTGSSTSSGSSSGDSKSSLAYLTCPL